MRTLSVVYSNSCGLPVDGTCAVSGAAGDEVVCTVRVARKHSAVPELTGLQFDVNYDPSLLAIVSLQQEVCGEDGCEVKDLEASPLRQAMESD